MKFLLVCLLCVPVFVFSQNPDSLLAAACLEKAVAFAGQNRPDSSYHYRQLALAYFVRKNDLAGWLGVWNKLGKALEQQGEDARSIELRQSALTALFRQPASREEWDKLAWAKVKIAYLLAYRLGDFDEARRHYEAAKTIFEENLDPTDPDVGDYVYRELGNIYTRLGDYEAARIMLGKFKDIAIRHRRFSHAAEACSDLALLFIDLADYDAAIDVCREGLALPELAPHTQGLLEANLAKSFFAKKEYPHALHFGLAAQRTFEGVVRRDEHARAKAWLSNALALCGETNAALNRYAEAEKQLLLALHTALDFYAPDLKRREVAKLYGSLGNFYLRWNKPRQALEYFHQALRHAIPGFEARQLDALPGIADFFPENAIKEALLGKATCFERLYELDNNFVYLEQALRCRSLSFEVDKQLRRVYRFESSKLKIIEESLQESERGIGTALRVRALSGKDAMLDSAFRFAEINKSVLLHQALRQGSARSVANVPDSLLRTTAALQREIAALEKDLFRQRQQKEAQAGMQTKLEDEIFRKKQRQQELMQRLGKDFPAFYHLNYEERLATVGAVQHQLQPRQALLEYFVGDSSIFIFLLKQDTALVERVDKNFPLEEWVVQFRKDIEAFQYAGTNREQRCLSYTELAQCFYRKLIQPVEKHGLPQDLIIVPGGILGFLPFDALLFEPPVTTCRFREYPYLVKRHNISYNYSSTLFVELLQEKRSKVKAGFAGFAPSFPEGNSSGFGALRFNNESVVEVARLFGGRAYLGDEATGEVFLQQAVRHRLLYLATHAKANAGEGDFSFVVLANGQGGFDTLFVKDVYHLPLSADLVFLGACETGNGRLYKGEGIIGLARGFLYAGARSIVTTLWSINDESNRKLTSFFFQNIREGKRKDQALYSAKLAHLSSELPDLYAHPVYWAAYTPIGNMEPLEWSRWHWQYAGVAIGLAGLLLFGWRFFKRKKTAPAAVPGKWVTA